jgi:hypothetical protein
MGSLREIRSQSYQEDKVFASQTKLAQKFSCNRGVLIDSNKTALMGYSYFKYHFMIVDLMKLRLLAS